MAAVGKNYVNARLLIEGGVDVNALSAISRTALHSACLKSGPDFPESVELVQLLLDAGVDPRVASTNELTAFCAALLSGYTASATAVLSALLGAPAAVPAGCLLANETPAWSVCARELRAAHGDTLLLAGELRAPAGQRCTDRG